MDLLAYWRLDNYRRDLDGGAGFHFNSKQARLHTALGIGERLWLVTRVVTKRGLNEYRIAARLVIRSKTINAPGYIYGPYRVWGHLERSNYYRLRSKASDDVFELLRLLKLDSGSLESSTRAKLAQSLQTMRGVTPKGSQLLEAFCEQLPAEPRAHLVVDELRLEKALDRGDEARLRNVVKNEHRGASEEQQDELLRSYPRNRQLTAEINSLYVGRCQVCSFDSLSVYAIQSAEAHHLVYRSRGGEDELENLVLLCPNHHTVVHRTEATFDYARLAFFFPTGELNRSA